MDKPQHGAQILQSTHLIIIDRIYMKHVLYVGLYMQLLLVSEV